jgi:hypothetical protein
VVRSRLDETHEGDVIVRPAGQSCRSVPVGDGLAISRFHPSARKGSHRMTTSGLTVVPGKSGKCADRHPHKTTRVDINHGKTKTLCASIPKLISEPAAFSLMIRRTSRRRGDTVAPRR